MNKYYLRILTALVLALMMIGCKSEQQEKKEQRELMAKTLSISTYNYTSYEIYAPRIMPTNERDIQNSASADSVFFNTSGLKKIDNNVSVSFSTGGCCFLWEKNANHQKMRVVWSVVYDHVKFYGNESKAYDDRKSKKPQPGSAWCEGEVAVMQPYPEKGDKFYIHFLPDGTLAAHVSKYADLVTNGPLSLEYIKQHLSPLPDGKYCLHEISNPWYGIPRKPHME